jgi:tetratricopeptide (TPR) repeat protein
LGLLSRIHLALYVQGGDRHNLAKAVDYATQALAVCDEVNVHCPMSLVICGCCLVYKSALSNAAQHLPIAELHFKEALELCPVGHPVRISALIFQANIYSWYFLKTNITYYFNKALGSQHMAVTQWSLLGMQSRPHCFAHVNGYYRELAALGGFLYHRTYYSEDTTGIEEGIRLCKDALTLCPVAHLDRAQVMVRLGEGLRRRFEMKGSPHDLEEAIYIGRQSLEFISLGIPLYPRLNSLLSRMLLYRFETIRASDQDLDEIIELKEKLLESLAIGHASHYGALNDLAVAVQMRFLWRGDIKDLDEAIRLHREVIDHTTKREDIRWIASGNLMQDLNLRYKVLGNVDDVDEALHLGRNTIDVVSPSNQVYTEIVSAFVSTLNYHFEITKDIMGLTEAIARSEERMQALSLGSPNRIECLRAISQALLLRGAHTQNLSDILKAIQYLDKKDCDFLDSFQGPDFLRILSALHLAKFRITKNIDDAIEAEDVTMDVLARVPRGRRLRFQCMLDTAELYLEQNTSFTSLSGALRYMLDAVADEHGDVRSRILGTVQLLRRVEKIYPNTSYTDALVAVQILNVYAKLVALLPRIAYFGIDNSARLQSLFIGQDIATTGALRALKILRLQQAVEILEQGRGLFWTQALRLRSDFDTVRDDIRRELLELAPQLERTVDISHTPAAMQQRLGEEVVSQRIRQTERFEALVRQVRTLPGHARFLLPDEYATLAMAAEKGPVVILISGQKGSEAIVVRSAGDPITIPLQSLATEWIAESGNNWRSVLNEAEEMRDSRLKIKPNRKSKSTISVTLEKLWQYIVQPVFSALQLTVSRQPLFEGSYNDDPC